MKAFLLLVAALGLPAHAFGPEGHRIVGEIAQQYLTPGALQGIEYLLRHDRLADRSPSGRKTIAEVAYWADEIKDFPWGRRMAAWHYDDVPVCGAPERAEYCKTNCASKRLEEQIALLGDRTAEPRRRNEALKWVVHLVGDIHQPLHAANNHDRGGNTVLVSFFGERENPPYGPVNLHAIWDVHLVRRLMEKDAAMVSGPIPEQQRIEWARGSVADWIAESHELAKRVVYANLPGGFACGHKHHAVLEIGEAYYAKAAPVLGEQIRKAGIRLARILNEALGR